MSYSSTILATAGLVSYWRLGETVGVTAVDEKALVNGTYSGGVTLGQTGLISADANNAPLFNTVDDIVTVPHNVALSPEAGAAGQLSIEFWVRLSSPFPTITWFVGKGFNEWYMSLDSSPGVLSWNVGDFGDYSQSITTDHVHHIVGTYDAANGRLAIVYVNGVAGTGGSPSGDVVGTTDDLTMGASSFTEANNTPGAMVIDEVALYNVALSPGTILDHYNLGIGVVGLTVPVQGMLDARIMTQGYDQSAVAPPSSDHSSKGLVMVGTG